MLNFKSGYAFLHLRGKDLNNIDTSKPINETRELHGRQIIMSDAAEITANNVIEETRKALNEYMLNKSEIEYLYNYYKGKQPILNRVKDIRPDICNRIIENRANEIVSFKVGYLCGEPIQYVSRQGDENIVNQINKLNEYMFAEDKASKDQELVEWQMICGTAFRLILPDPPQDVDDSPFEIYTLDPRNTFIVYSSKIGHDPLMSVIIGKDEDGENEYSVYTDNMFFTIKNDFLVKAVPHSLKSNPITEYPANNSRLGAFEIVLPLLDAINKVASNRMDGVEQFIQAFWKFVGCNIDKDTFESFKEQGAILIPPNDNGGKIDVDLIVKELNQNQVQTLKDDLYNAILTICGMPNRNGGSSTSDTGAAVLLRDGWSLAEARAKDSEHMFKKAEKQMLKLILRICKDLSEFNLKLKDIDMKFTRRNYENIQSKSQVLLSMLKEPKIHPQLAFQHSGMFSDSESAYAMSMKYYKEMVRENFKTQNAEKQENSNSITEDVKRQEK